MTNVTVTVTATKSDWEAPIYTLWIDGSESDFDERASRLLTETTKEYYFKGIFNRTTTWSKFCREDTEVSVDFGDIWDVDNYENPAIEIQRRVALVADAFEEARESYEKSWTVTI
jgi:hypothetical protein